MQPPPRKGIKAATVLRGIHSEQLAKLQAKHHQECELLEDLRNFTKQRSSIEKQYADALLKLSSSFLQKKIPVIAEIKSDDGQERRTVYTLWRSLLEEGMKLSNARLAAAEVYHHEISESCKAVKANKVHAAKKCFEQLQKMHEELQSSVRELDKSKKIYNDDEHVAHEARDKALEAEEKLKRKKGKMFQSISSLQKNSAKFSMKREACDIKSAFARNEYLLQLAASNAHQTRYFEHDLPEIIKMLDSEAYERVTEYIQLLSRTELLTCAATQASYSKILAMADLNTRQYNLECFFSEFPVMKNMISYPFEPWEGDQIDFITNDHNTQMSLNKEARKAAAAIVKNSRIIEGGTKQLKTALQQLAAGQKDLSDPGILDLEQKIEELRQALRKGEAGKVKAEARVDILRTSGVNVGEWIQTVELENLGPFDASAGGLSRSGSMVSIKTDVSGYVEERTQEVANDSFYDSDFNDAASDISGNVSGTATSAVLETSVEAVPEKFETISEVDIAIVENGDTTSMGTSSEAVSSRYSSVIVVALYNYEALNPDELTIVENEQLEIIGEGDGDGWIKARNYEGVEGYIPQNYVEMEGGQAVPISVEPAPVSFSSVDYLVPVSQPSDNVDEEICQIEVIQVQAAKEMICRALYDYEATCPEELSFAEGQIIRILRKEVCDVDDGWWEGDLEGQVGIFPSLVVEELNGDQMFEVEEIASPPGSAPPLFSPPPMPQYLLPPAQVIITQPTPMAEHADQKEEEEENPPGEAASYSQQASGFEMELSEAQHVQYHGQFSSDSDANTGDVGDAYVELVSSPDTPSRSPIRVAPQPPCVKVEEHGDNESSVAEEQENEMNEEGKREAEVDDANIAMMSTGLENQEGTDITSMDSVPTDPGSSPSNATGDESIDTVVNLDIGLAQDGAEEDLKSPPLQEIETEGIDGSQAAPSSTEVEMERSEYLPAPVVEVNDSEDLK